MQDLPAAVHKYRPGPPIFPAEHVLATQCISCGHVEAPAADPAKCAGCGAIGDDVRVFPAMVIEAEDAGRVGLRWDPDDLCLCDHYYDDHNEGGECLKFTLGGRAKCSCPGFKHNG